MNCVVCGKEHNFPRRTTCGILCWRKIKPKEYRKKLSAEAANRMKRNASRKYPCFTCLRLLGVKNSEIAERHGVDVRVASFAVVDSVPRRVSKAEKFKCGFCLRRIGLGAVRVAKLIPGTHKSEWSVMFKEAGLRDLPIIKPLPYSYRTSDLTYDEKELYRDGLELDAWFPDWDLDMIAREEVRRSGCSYQMAKYRSLLYSSRKKSANYAKQRHHKLKHLPTHKLKMSARNAMRRIYLSHGIIKTRKTQTTLGCSYKHAALHIESLFKRGMNWDNYGEWEIDHVMPLSAFNLDDPKHYEMACHYTNLQPLWKSENRMKSDSIVNHQSLLTL